jgi:hypothetical protein
MAGLPERRFTAERLLLSQRNPTTPSISAFTRNPARSSRRATSFGTSRPLVSRLGVPV